ncbi:hypothetical protein TNCT_355331 [Trichonephila clavata]|uniref:Uncharacterized protein n=1 Tax=Trichonephila clavata TaxID=2740835 RepID=A0A8X6GPZ5_TRICU|nr:hypothetical protein TNCT_355331 [Trichonephila clavata]
MLCEARKERKLARQNKDFRLLRRKPHHDSVYSKMDPQFFPIMSDELYGALWNLKAENLSSPSLSCLGSDSYTELCYEA